MAVLLHAVPLAGVCRKERSSPVPQVRARPEEMRCVGSKRTPEVGRDMLLAASIVKFSGPKGPVGNRTVRSCEPAGGMRAHWSAASCRASVERRSKPAVWSSRRAGDGEPAAGRPDESAALALSASDKSGAAWAPRTHS